MTTVVLTYRVERRGLESVDRRSDCRRCNIGLLAAFGAAIGLSLTSRIAIPDCPSRRWRSPAAIWMVMVHVWSFTAEDTSPVGCPRL